MDQTVVGLFDNFSEAQSVVQELVNAGFKRENISLVANDAKGEYAKYTASGDKVKDAAGAGAVGGTVVGGLAGLLTGLGALAIPGIGPVLAAGPLLGFTAAGAGLGAATGGLLNGLVAAGVPQNEAGYYAEGVRRGGTLVTVNTDDRNAQRASDIMTRAGAVDIDERSASWTASGWKGWNEKAQPYTADQLDKFRSTSTATNTNRTMNQTGQAETVLPVVEEQLKVGKREVERGGVRVYTRVTEKPVEEQVTLREEHVNVERRPVDRPLRDADVNAFKEQSIEMTERAEEAVVSKSARVVEEVVVGKDVNERTETVRDTIRRTDVEVEQTPGTQRTGETMTTNTVGFDTYTNDFRSDYEKNYAKSGYTFDQYSPVYRYGYDLGSDQRYTNSDWNTIEQQARSRWEERNPNTWDQFKNAIRYAWDRARGAAGTGSNR